jgi:S-adenosylmethionine:tRNA ribosyltransferase-isomerase
MTDIYDLNSYDYDLPEGMIATHPASPRDAAKLLVWDSLPQHKIFSDLIDYLNEGDVLVVNNSSVIPARLFGVRPARDENAPPVNIEFLLHKMMISPVEWTAFARPAKRLRQGDRIDLPGNVTAEITGRLDDQITLKFNLQQDEVFPYLQEFGHVPLPPYIDRADDNSDKSEYQTVYADEHAKGSVAAPTAGLHFTDELIEKIKTKGVTICEVTLHVGAGTFLSVMTDDIRQHKMHAEWGIVTKENADLISQAKAAGHKIIAVGTTATRLLETAARETGQIQPWQGETDIFINPGFEFKVVDRLVTNFHLPKSTLLMLVSAFIGGVPNMQALYREAIENNYRFYSYGDACLLTRA